MKVKKFDWDNLLLLSTCLALLIGAMVYVIHRDNTDGPRKGPSGRVTQKMWVQEFWQAGEQLYPARWCLELNYRDEVCIPESNWNKYSIGDWYK